MKVIKLDKLAIINEMCKKWTKFKKRRNSKAFEFKTGPGFLTINEREDMLDHIFNILKYHVEDLHKCVISSEVER